MFTHAELWFLVRKLINPWQFIILLVDTSQVQPQSSFAGWFSISNDQYRTFNGSKKTT